MKFVFLCVLPALSLGLSLVVPSTVRAENAASGLTFKETGSRPISATDLARLGDMSGLTLSPDGRFLAFQQRRGNPDTNDYDVRWMVLSLNDEPMATTVGDGGAFTSFTAPNGRKSGGWHTLPARWSNDSGWLAYLARNDGAIQLWRSNTDGSSRQALTQNPANVLDFVWSEDDRRIVYKVGCPRERLEHLAQEVRATGYLYDDRIWPIENAAPYITCEAGRENITEYWSVSLNNLQERPARRDEIEHFNRTPRPQSTRISIPPRTPIQAPSGSRAVWLQNADPDRYAGVLPPLTVAIGSAEDLEPTKICNDDRCRGRLEKLWWADDGKTVYFQKSAGANQGERHLLSWNTEKDMVSQLSGAERYLSECQVNNDQAYCFAETPTQPRVLSSIDLTSGVVDTLYDPNPHFQELKLGTVRKLEWANEFGIRTFGHLALPIDYQEGRQYPLVVVQYRSRGFLRGGVGDEYPIHLFAANGFAVLSVDRPDEQELYETLDSWDAIEIEAWRNFRERRSSLSSLETAIGILKDEGVVDPARIGITGLSDGAETAYFGLINTSLFSAASISSGGWDPILYHVGGLNMQAALRSYGLENPDGPDAEKWNEISPALNASRINAPLLIQAADSEYLFSLQTVTALKDAKKPVELVVFPGEYHLKWQPAHRLRIYERNLDWFNFWLQGVEHGDPEKADQYARWRAMTRNATIADQAQ